MDKKAQTVETYDRNAAGFRKKFADIGPRIGDIEETFRLSPKKNPKVLEIGCAYGREAAEILKRTDDYLGIDISEKMIELARESVPAGRFEVADAASFEFPHNLDVVFAFASLLHLPKENLKDVLDSVSSVLNSGGLFRISLKQRDEYGEMTKEDEFGTRTFYFYSPEDIRELAAGRFDILKMESKDLRDDKWLEVMLRKPG